MDTNGTTGAYCVVSGDGHRFYGDTRQEAHDAMLASAAASARTLARFGEDFLPADVAEALPALPDGYEYLVLERKHLEPAGYDGGYGDETYVRVGYEWRAFAVRRVPAGPEGDEATAWHSGSRRDDHVTGNVGRGPAVLHINDVPYESERIVLFPDSLEFVDGAWIPCAAMELPPRDASGKALPALPGGYGLLEVDSPDDGDYGCDQLFAVPNGTHTLSRADYHGGLHEFATVTVGNDLATVSEYECLSEGPLGMPPGTLVLVRDAWVAYDRTEYGRWGMTLEEERADAARGWGGGYGGLLPSGDGGGEEDE